MSEEKDIWAITTYFNPLHYQSRLKNYKQFRRNLALRLCTVEHSLNGNYELNNEDAEILISVCSKDLLWQKERLLNLALNKLPHDAKIIVWLDCDVVFSNKNWHFELHHKLQNIPVLQCYSELVDLAQGAELDTLIGTKIPANGISIASVVKTNAIELSISTLIDNESMRGASPGGAWAAHRSLLQRHGFYDAMILGGGDRLFAYACLGKIEDAISIARLDNARAEHYRRWAEPFFDTVNGQVGVIDGQLLHLWHGSISDRQYILRHKALNKIQFDLYRDIELDESGAWKWTPSASQELKQLVTSYFAARSEDGRTENLSVNFQIIDDK